MIKAPSAKSLIERFRLRERGRERGLLDRPPHRQRTLDEIEIEVVDHCRKLRADRRDDYREHCAALEGRLRGKSGGASVEDGHAGDACGKMKRALERERTEIEGVRKRAQTAISELNAFKLRHGRESDAKIPDSPVLALGILAVLVVVETLINALFLGLNLEGGIFQGFSYAILISILNVVALGFVAAWGLRRTRHVSPGVKASGAGVLITVITAAFALNLLFAHYREAVERDAELPAGAAVLDGAAARNAAGAQEPCSAIARADSRALCLFLESPFVLGGFYAYLLLMVGLLMFAAGAIDWFKLDDPYPGYGARERHWRAAKEALDDEHQDLSKEIGAIHDEALRRERGGFIDPAQTQELAMDAYHQLKRRHDSLCNYASDLAQNCATAINLYREANRMARSQPEPAAWAEDWRPEDWEPEAPPSAEAIPTEAEAESRSRTAHAELRRREELLQECRQQCVSRLNGLVELDEHASATPGDEP